MVVLHTGASSTERAICSTTLTFQSAKYNDSRRLTFCGIFSFSISRITSTVLLLGCADVLLVLLHHHNPFSRLNLFLGHTFLSPRWHNPPPRRSTRIINLSDTPTSPTSLPIVPTPLLIASKSPIKPLARLYIVAE